MFLPFPEYPTFQDATMEINSPHRIAFCDKGTLLSESTDVFVITPNRLTFFFLETENFDFGDF